MLDVKALVKEVAPQTYVSSSCKAILGISDAVSTEQIALAHQVANHIQIPLVEVKTKESDNPMYVQNEGNACFACKTALYSALHAVADYANIDNNNKNAVTLFNGTNADDRKDETRVGLIAADNFNVASPLRYSTKEQVREAARYMGLPNWNHAASPCLRSRLAIGVKATRDHLKMIESAEHVVKRMLNWEHDATKDFRVRLLARKRAVIEVDRNTDIDIASIHNRLQAKGVDEKLRKLGFTGGLADIRPFKSGSVSVTKGARNGTDHQSSNHVRVELYKSRTNDHINSEKIENENFHR